jgi:hypothetical protein
MINLNALNFADDLQCGDGYDHYYYLLTYQSALYSIQSITIDPFDHYNVLIAKNSFSLSSTNESKISRRL